MAWTVLRCSLNPYWCWLSCAFCSRWRVSLCFIILSYTFPAMGRRLIGLYELGLDQCLFPAFLIVFILANFQASGNSSFSNHVFKKARKSRRLPSSIFIRISGRMRSGPGAFLGFVFLIARFNYSNVIGGSRFCEIGVVFVLLTPCWARSSSRGLSGGQWRTLAIPLVPVLPFTIPVLPRRTLKSRRKCRRTAIWSCGVAVITGFFNNKLLP